MSIHVAAALAAVAFSLAAVPAQAHTPRTDARDERIVLVHGYDASLTSAPGVDCEKEFGAMRDALRRWGWAQSIYMVGYYTEDVCNATINNDGNHDVHYGRSYDPLGHNSNGTHNRQTDIRHLGYHLAWDIYNRYSSQNRIHVDLFGHSMGGLIIRYALGAVEKDTVGFPDYLDVEDVVTGGTPHGGTSWIAEFCSTTQCSQMDGDSDFMKMLTDPTKGFYYSPDAKHYGGTDWSTFGSGADITVPAHSAAGTWEDRSREAYMGSCHKLWYNESEGVSHGEFKTDVRTEITARAWKIPTNTCGTGWQDDPDYYWPVRAADQSMLWGNR